MCVMEWNGKNNLMPKRSFTCCLTEKGRGKGAGCVFYLLLHIAKQIQSCSGKDIMNKPCWCGSGEWI